MQQKTENSYKLLLETEELYIEIEGQMSKTIG